MRITFLEKCYVTNLLVSFRIQITALEFYLSLKRAPHRKGNDESILWALDRIIKQIC